MLSKIWTSPLLIPNTMFFPSGDHSTFVSCRPFSSFPQILFPSTEPTITAPKIQNTNQYQMSILIILQYVLLFSVSMQFRQTGLCIQSNWLTKGPEMCIFHLTAGTFLFDTRITNQWSMLHLVNNNYITCSYTCTCSLLVCQYLVTCHYIMYSMILRKIIKNQSHFSCMNL